MVSGKSESLEIRHKAAPQALTPGWPGEADGFFLLGQEGDRVAEPTLMAENSRFSAKMFWVCFTSSLEEPPFSLQKDFYCQCP